MLIGLLFAVLLMPGNTPAWGEKDYPNLYECFDEDLQQGLERVLADQNLMDAVKQRKLNIALADIADLKRPRVAAVNGNHMVYAASLPKIAILFAAFKMIEKGEMKLDNETRHTLTEMIRKSSNEAASTMLRRVGPEKIAEILQSPPYRLYDPETNGGIWCGKEYGSKKAWKRDPLHNLSHGATALQVARFYYLLETGQLVSPELTREMKAILVDPAINHKFVKGLRDRSNLKIYRKSGTWKSWHADSAMVEWNNHKYIAVGLTNDPNGGKWLESIILPLHLLLTSDHRPSSRHSP